jgi:hypothetical protein
VWVGKREREVKNRVSNPEWEMWEDILGSISTTVPLIIIKEAKPSTTHGTRVEKHYSEENQETLLQHLQILFIVSTLCIFSYGALI